MTESITLKKLLVWTANVRKTYSQRAIDEMPASITAHTLLQSLVVRKDKRGKFTVVAGGRRLRALIKLAEEGTMPWNTEIPCKILAEDADATEVSLAENVVHEPMHPADEFEAFQKLIESGKPVADIAARFGVTEKVVQQRLRLARVSPVLIAAYRKDEMTLQHLMAFTVSSDHAEQERILLQQRSRASAGGRC